MSSRDSMHDNKLKALEKWRNLELDQAQTHHSKMRSQELHAEREVASVENAISQSHEFTREEVSTPGIISVDKLIRTRAYTVHQTRELKKAEELRDQARDQSSAAREVLLQKHENVSVVERLQKRRETQAAKESSRREQRWLDDQALLRVSAQARSTIEGK